MLTRALRHRRWQFVTSLPRFVASGVQKAPALPILGFIAAIDA
jgi:hypothetical protein